jgi:hypothetical protein
MTETDQPLARAARATSGGMDEAKRVIVLSWHRNWLIPLRLTVFVRMSASLASVVNRK